LRAIAWKQWKYGPARFAELRRRGVGRNLAAQTAGNPSVCPVVWEGRSREASPYPDYLSAEQIPDHRERRDQQHAHDGYAQRRAYPKQGSQHESGPSPWQTLPRRAHLQCVTSHCNEGTECYLIVTCMVITDVPEAFFPLPVAVIAKVSLPLYLAFAVYW
jgi:hypothetical protein